MKLGASPNLGSYVARQRLFANVGPAHCFILDNTQNVLRDKKQANALGSQKYQQPIFELMRALQDETRHFVTFTPLSFHPEGTQLADLEEELRRQRDRAVTLSRQVDDEKRARQKAEIELGIARRPPNAAAMPVTSSRPTTVSFPTPVGVVSRTDLAIDLDFPPSSIL